MAEKSAKTTSNRTSETKTASGAKRSPRGGKHTKKPAHRGVYTVTSLVFNFVFGFMGIGIGFVFFLSMVIATGAPVLQLLVFLIGAVAICVYLYIILLANRRLVFWCSDKKSRRVDRNRMYLSMLYVICVFVVCFAYSFLRAAGVANGVS
jgi:nitric oxide reductase large subunit